jgi:hypothetical protein
MREFAADQVVSVRFCDELDDDDITIFEELPTEEWYSGAFLIEKMPDSVRAELAKYEQEDQKAHRSMWAWRVFTLALAVACAWACLRTW